MVKTAHTKSPVGTEFVITRQYDAPRELVWLACTDARHLAQWWGPRGFTAPVCEWAARPGTRFLWSCVVKEFGAIEGGKQTLERLGEYLPKMN